MVKELQAGIKLYNGGMRYNGVRIQPEKCWCYLIGYTLHIKQPDQLVIPIKRLNPSRATEHIGIFISQYRKNINYIKVNKNNIKDWAY